MGTFDGVDVPRPENSSVDYQVLTGTGAYEGLTYVGQAVDCFSGPQFFGAIHESGDA